MNQNSFNQSNHFNNINEENHNQEYKIVHEIHGASRGEEIDCNLQTPLMFSRFNSSGSITGFEQQDDQNSAIREFHPKTSRHALTPSFNKNQTSDIHCKLYSSPTINNAQEKLCGNTFVERNTNASERISIYTNVSFQYDVAFKKPHFLKHSVFEDDIAAFKDESSPNILSTAASSLSSLTIDDDDYNDSSLTNKATLVKKKISSINLLQNSHYQEYCRHDPIGSANESEPIAEADIKKVVNQVDHKIISHPDEKFCAQRNLINDTFICKEPKIIWNHKNSQCLRNLQDSNLKKDRTNSKNQSQGQVFKKGKFLNILQDNEESFVYHKIQSKTVQNEKPTKDLTYERYRNEKLEYREKRQIFEDCYKSGKELSNCTEENNEVDAYEEQLLDQCIRRGMAKVTKQKITDIKPFSWDLNHICLTTRIMFGIKK